MATFVSEGVELLTERMEELDVLLAEADRYAAGTSRLYPALCRSIQVLAVSHFEGYIKDLVKNVLDDINSRDGFRESSRSLKFTFCKNFIAPLLNGKPNHSKILELITVFDLLKTKFNASYFYEANKNPKESILNKIAENFGEDALFSKLNHSELIAVFSNTHTENLEMRDSIKARLSSSIDVFPYLIDDIILNVDVTNQTRETYWETFIQTILAERHKIAHGNLENSNSHVTIRSNIIKLEILLLAITYLLSQRGNPVVGVVS